MALHNKALSILASKLGLAEEDKVLNKAAEFERLLHTKSVAGSTLNDTSKTVVCLDLAAGFLGADLDLKTAVKYSGLKAAAYKNIRNMVQNLLDLNEDRPTTLVLCNTLQCTPAQNLADKILEEYKKHAKNVLDLCLPQYVCMAVFQACRVLKLKVAKSKIVERSRLKPAQWSKLDEDWTKFVDENISLHKKKRGRPLKNTDKDDIEDEMEVDSDIIKPEVSKELKVEPYEVWKKRILDGAYAELKKLDLHKKDHNRGLPETPRRSPRKTPQKFSPYKSPTKRGGVRLLFPSD